MNRQTKRLVLNSLLIAAGLAGVSIAVSGLRFGVEVLTVGALGTLNLLVWARLVLRLIAAAGTGSSSPAALAAGFVFKYVLVFGVLILLVFGFGFNPIAIAVGISNVPLAAVFEAILPQPAGNRSGG